MKIAIVGTAGIPANYGGFETLVQNLAEFHKSKPFSTQLVVYCSAANYKERPAQFLNAQLRYIPLSANGVWSIPYDIWSILSALSNRADTLLLLGVSGAIALPVLRFLTGVRVVTNIDGIEWRRQKWRGLAKWFLRFSERLAVRYSDVVIADNAAIASYVETAYSIKPSVIAYGGDHAVRPLAIRPNNIDLPNGYAFSVCRIEPENNIDVILEAFSNFKNIPLVFVGNWESSAYGRGLRSKFGPHDNLYLLDPIYDPGMLRYLRENARLYVHGHSAGGTNPSLVEAMHFGLMTLAYDCDFNRSTTEESCLYFKDASSLTHLLTSLEQFPADAIGEKLKEIAERRYTWQVVAQDYFTLLEGR